MPHVVTGLIIKDDFVHKICSEYPVLRQVTLEQGFSLFPLTNELFENLGISQPVGLIDSDKFPNEITDLLAELSNICPLLYFETEYFGGEGSQFAMVFENGIISLGPVQGSIGPINEGLHLLGVETDDDFDEFDALGLGKQRSSNDWLNEIG